MLSLGEDTPKRVSRGRRRIVESPRGITIFSRLSKIQEKKGNLNLTTRVVQEVRTTVKCNVGVRGEPECEDLHTPCHVFV